MKLAIGKWQGQFHNALVVGGMAHLLHDGFTDMLYIFFPLWQVQFTLSFAEIGFLKTLFSGTMAMFQVPASYLAVGFGEVRLLLVGTILTSVAVYGYGWSTNWMYLACLLVAGGLGSSVQHPLSSSLIAKAYKDGEGRRVALGTFNTSGDIGKLLLPAGASFLVGMYSWQTASQMLGLLGLMAVVLLWQAGKSLPEEKYEPGKKAEGKVGVGWSENKGFWALLLIGIVDSGARMGFLTFFPFVLQAKGAEVATIGLAFSLVFAGGVMGKMLCGLLASRFGVLTSIAITEMLTSIGILSMLYIPLSGELMLAFLLGIVLNGTSSVLYGSVPELVSEESQKQAFAVFYTATILSGALSPWLYGVVSDQTGITVALILVASMVLLSLPLLLPIKQYGFANKGRSI